MAVSAISFAASEDGRGGVVTFQSDLKDGSQAIQELQGGGTKQLGIKVAAQHGVGDPRCNSMTITPYPVTAEGKTVHDPRADKVAAYRADIEYVNKLL